MSLAAGVGSGGERHAARVAVHMRADYIAGAGWFLFGGGGAGVTRLGDDGWRVEAAAGSLIAAREDDADVAFGVGGAWLPRSRRTDDDNGVCGPNGLTSFLANWKEVGPGLEMIGARGEGRTSGLVSLQAQAAFTITGIPCESLGMAR